jgi:hypothetical protein
MEKDFVIFKVSWLTQTPGNEHRRQDILNHFLIVTNFLQDNGLTTKPLIDGPEDITDDFTLSSSDLTADGLAVMRSAYHKWLTAVDNGMSPENLSLFEKALKRVRS